MLNRSFGLLGKSSNNSSTDSDKNLGPGAAPSRRESKSWLGGGGVSSGSGQLSTESNPELTRATVATSSQPLFPGSSSASTILYGNYPSSEDGVNWGSGSLSQAASASGSPAASTREIQGRGTRSPSLSGRKSVRPGSFSRMSMSGPSGRPSTVVLPSTLAAHAEGGASTTTLASGGGMGVLARDEDWLALQKVVLGVFQKPQQYQHLRIESLHTCVARVERNYTARAIVDMYTLIICKGMIILREGLRDLESDEFIRSLAEIWGTFYTETLTLLLSMFGVSNGVIFPCIRKITLTAFRDHVVLSSAIKQQLDDVLSRNSAGAGVDGGDGKNKLPFLGGSAMFLPPRITQMLLVLQGCNNNDRYERDIQRLLSRLIPCLIQAETEESPVQQQRTNSMHSLNFSAGLAEYDGPSPVPISPNPNVSLSLNLATPPESPGGVGVHFYAPVGASSPASGSKFDQSEDGIEAMHPAACATSMEGMQHYKIGQSDAPSQLGGANGKEEFNYGILSSTNRAYRQSVSMTVPLHISAGGPEHGGGLAMGGGAVSMQTAVRRAMSITGDDFMFTRKERLDRTVAVLSGTATNGGGAGGEEDKSRLANGRQGSVGLLGSSVTGPGTGGGESGKEGGMQNFAAQLEQMETSPF